MICRYPVTWLDTVTNPRPLYHNPAVVPRVYWDASLSLDNLAAVDCTQLLEEQRQANETRDQSGDEVDRPILKRLLTNLLRYGFTFIDNTPMNLDGTISATDVVSFPQAIQIYILGHLLPFFLIGYHTTQLARTCRPEPPPLAVGLSAEFLTTAENPLKILRRPPLAAEFSFKFSSRKNSR